MAFAWQSNQHLHLIHSCVTVTDQLGITSGLGTFGHIDGRFGVVRNVCRSLNSVGELKMWMVNTNCFGLTGLHVTVDVDWSVAFVAVRIDPLHAGLMRRSWRWIRLKLEARPGHFGCSGWIIFLWDRLLMHWFFEYIDFIPQSNNLVFQILFDLNLFFLNRWNQSKWDKLQLFQIRI
jgi:hypothetical protein